MLSAATTKVIDLLMQYFLNCASILVEDLLEFTVPFDQVAKFISVHVAFPFLKFVLFDVLIKDLTIALVLYLAEALGRLQFLTNFENSSFIERHQVIKVVLNQRRLSRVVLDNAIAEFHLLKPTFLAVDDSQ